MGNNSGSKMPEGSNEGGGPDVLTTLLCILLTPSSAGCTPVADVF